MFLGFLITLKNWVCGNLVSQEILFCHFRVPFIKNATTKITRETSNNQKITLWPKKRSNINFNLGPSYIGVLFTPKVSTKSFSLYVEDPLFVTLFMKVIRSLAILFKVHLKLCIRPKWNSSFNWEFSSTPNKQMRVHNSADRNKHATQAAEGAFLVYSKLNF